MCLRVLGVVVCVCVRVLGVACDVCVCVCVCVRECAGVVCGVLAPAGILCAEGV